MKKLLSIFVVCLCIYAGVVCLTLGEIAEEWSLPDEWNAMIEEHFEWMAEMEWARESQYLFFPWQNPELEVEI